jgi:SAM-dependent methyltransferase
MHTAYLEAKRVIDDRSLNRMVWNHMVERVARIPARPLRIAEIGAGTGTMLDRLTEWGFFAAVARDGRPVTYDAWEINPVTAALLQERLSRTGEIESGTAHVGDVRERKDGGTYDLVIANAVLDLFRPAEMAEMVAGLLAPGGLLYGSIVFDGVTLLEPGIDEGADTEILRLYHRSMTQGFGRRHVLALRAAGFEIAEIGSSDWIVPPRASGPTPEERELIGTVLGMMEEAVSHQIAALPDAAITREELIAWIARRRNQLDDGEILFEAHQMDFVALR